MCCIKCVAYRDAQDFFPCASGETAATRKSNIDLVLYGADQDTANEIQNRMPKINTLRAVGQCFSQIVVTHAGLRNDVKGGRHSNDYYYGVKTTRCIQKHITQSWRAGACNVLQHL